MYSEGDQLFIKVEFTGHEVTERDRCDLFKDRSMPFQGGAHNHLDLSLDSPVNFDKQVELQTTGRETCLHKEDANLMPSKCSGLSHFVCSLIAVNYHIILFMCGTPVTTKNNPFKEYLSRLCGKYNAFQVTTTVMGEKWVFSL